MSKDQKVLCDSKQYLIESIEMDNISMQVYVLNNKKSIKSYCKDRELPYKVGFKNWRGI